MVLTFAQEILEVFYRVSLVLFVWRIGPDKRQDIVCEYIGVGVGAEIREKK